MSLDGDQTCEQARFAAREFVARWTRETNAPLSELIKERMLFAYEMGYLRGASEASRIAMKMFEETKNDAE